jgi:hypothetical protein
MPVAGISKVVDMPVRRMDAEDELRVVRSAEREAA